MEKEEINVMITLVSDRASDALHDLLRSNFTDNKVYIEPGVRVLRLAPGVFLQLVGPGCQPPSYIPMDQALVSFRVSNLTEATEKLLAQGAKILHESSDELTGFSISYIRMQNGSTIGLMQ